MRNVIRDRLAHIHCTYSAALSIFALRETDVKLGEEARVFLEFLMRNCIMRSSPYSPGNFSPPDLFLGMKVEDDYSAVPSDFEFLKTIGKGSFGRVSCIHVDISTWLAPEISTHMDSQVFQVKHKHDHKIYAMKVLSKEHIRKKNEVGPISCWLLPVDLYFKPWQLDSCSIWNSFLIFPSEFVWNDILLDTMWPCHTKNSPDHLAFTVQALTSSQSHHNTSLFVRLCVSSLPYQSITCSSRRNLLHNI